MGFLASAGVPVTASLEMKRFTLTYVKDARGSVIRGNKLTEIIDVAKTIYVSRRSLNRTNGLLV